MDVEVIKSFLVGLGFGVDDASLAKFNKSIAVATLKVTALYASIKIAAAGIFFSISKISQGFEDMGYNLRLVAPAVNKMLILRQAMLDAYRHAGVDLTKVVKQSILFNMSLAKTKFALEAVYKSVGARFLPMLTKQMDIFRAKIFANMPKIQGALEKFVKVIFKAFEATVILGSRLWSILGRVYDFLKTLDDATGGWSTKIIAAIAIWKAFNLAFLATPLGMIIGGLVAILALFDDFKTWQEGGESLFDWAPFIPVIQAVGDVLGSVKDTLGQVFAIIFDVAGAFVDLFHLDFSGFKNSMGWIFDDVVKLVDKATDAIANLFRTFQALIGWAPSAVGFIGNLFGGKGAGANTAGVAQPAPLMPQNSSTNQRVSQETNILVQGSADAGAVGRSVASEQNKVNADMTRNMKGATR